MYRTVDTALWTDPRVKGLSAQAKLLFLYFITNSHSHVSGIYYLPRPMIAYEAGLPAHELDTLCDTLSGAGLVKFDTDKEVVWVVNMFRYQGRGEKNHISAAAQLRSLHKSFLCNEFVRYYPSVATVKNGYPIDTLSIGVPGLGSQEQEQEQEQEQNTLSPDKPAKGKRSGKTPRTTTPRPRDELFDAVCEVTASDPQASGSFVGRVCKALRSADPPFTPAEVRALSGILSKRNFSLPLTLGSVEKYIGLTRATPAKPVTTEADLEAKIRAQREEADRQKAKKADRDTARHILGINREDDA